MRKNKTERTGKEFNDSAGTRKDVSIIKDPPQLPSKTEKLQNDADFVELATR